MSKFNKIITIIISISLVLAIILGILTKQSFKTTNVSDEIRNSYTFKQFFTSVENPEEHIKMQIEDFLSHAEIIAKVRFTGVREHKYHSLLSTVDVIEVYKGDKRYENKQINVYEQAAFYEKSQVCTSYTNFLPMTENEEYFVFLTKMDYIDSYQEKLELEEFCIYCGDIGWFRAENKPLPVIKEDTVKYMDVIEYDFLYHSVSDFNQCMEMKNMIMKYFNIDHYFPMFEELAADYETN